jgi:hypothetical protein
MEAIMTVTDLVRDTCKTASRMIQRGDRITVKSGNKVLLRIVPSKIFETKMTPRQYKSFVKDLEMIASKADLDANPIVKMRREWQ